LITPNVAGSSTINFGLTGSLDVKRPSNGSSLAYFNDGGITMSAPP